MACFLGGFLSARGYTLYLLYKSLVFPHEKQNQKPDGSKLKFYTSWFHDGALFCMSSTENRSGVCLRGRRPCLNTANRIFSWICDVSVWVIGRVDGHTEPGGSRSYDTRAKDNKQHTFPAESLHQAN